MEKSSLSHPQLALWIIDGRVLFPNWLVDTSTDQPARDRSNRRGDTRDLARHHYAAICRSLGPASFGWILVIYRHPFANVPDNRGHNSRRHSPDGDVFSRLDRRLCSKHAFPTELTISF